MPTQILNPILARPCQKKCLIHTCKLSGRTLGNCPIRPQPLATAIPSGLKEGMSNLGMQQLITGMTHNRGNTLDHIYTNICKDGLRFGQLNSLTKTDHLPIYVSLKSKINT